jgi:hypothetical protein
MLLALVAVVVALLPGGRPRGEFILLGRKDAESMMLSVSRDDSGIALYDAAGAGADQNARCNQAGPSRRSWPADRLWRDVVAHGG